MKKVNQAIFLFVSFVSFLSFPFTGISGEGPKVNEQDFFQVLLQLQRTYSTDFYERGVRLKIRKLWNSQSTRTSSFLEGNERHYIIIVPGGLARQPRMTVDSLALAACHELGHFLGGGPKKIHKGEKSWKAIEGQADYFATAKCLKRIFNDRTENRAAYLSLSEDLKNKIKKECRTFQCARIVAAGLQYALTQEELRKEVPQVDLAKRDPMVAKEPLPSYPSTQCRLDTFIAGATCPVPWEEEFDAYDLSAGACTRDALDPEEWKSVRPACWFGTGI